MDFLGLRMALMTKDELDQIAQEGETLHTEFKAEQVHPDGLAAAFVSFLNSDGGVLWLGLEDNGSIGGIADVDRARQRVDQILANNVTPRATAFIEQIVVDDRTLLKITLPKGLDRPYYTRQGQCYVRVNAGKRLASREEIRRMYMAVRSFYFDESAVMGTTLADVDSENLENFLNSAYGLAVEPERSDSERSRLLQNLKAMVGPELSVAGVLLFARAPQRHLPTARIEYAHFAGRVAGEAIHDRKSIEGRLPQQLEQLDRLLRLALRNGGVIQGFQPESRPEVPLEMLREALTNALVHRDYSLSAPIRILLFDDRLEIHSPGPLPNGVTIENVRAGIHVERNPIILSLMGKLGLMTRLGTGILRIFRLAQDNGLPEPLLIATPAEFVVTLYRPVR